VIISIKRYRDIICDFDFAILWHPDIVRYHAQMHVSHVHCLPAQTAFTHSQQQLHEHT